MSVLGAVRVGPEECRDFGESSRLEWLEADGLGGFACGTVAGVQARRYHALLVAATRPPVERCVLLSHFEETLAAAGERFGLGASAWEDGSVEPRGFERLAGFALDPWPTWTYEFPCGTLRREVLMADGRPGVLVRWLWTPDDGATPAEMELRPFFAWRDYHEIAKRREGGEISLTPERFGWRAAVGTPSPTGLPAAGLGMSCAFDQETGFRAEPRWAEGFAYAIERERGDPEPEDKHSPGSFLALLKPGEPLTFWAGLEQLEPEDFEELPQRELARRAALGIPSRPDCPDAALLARAADQFVVRRGSGLSTVVAGYPWFTDWGRDTMIALPGLALRTGRLDEAEGMLLAFAEAADRGMIPNRFPDEGETPAYNTIDASLWFFEAARQWLEAGGDRERFHRRLWPTFRFIVQWHERGTRYGIGVDPEDGLLRGGDHSSQLTWMDAKYGDDVFTPRHGKAVEINALWVNALRLAKEWGEEFGDLQLAERCEALAEQAAESFNAKFWNPERDCLFDVIESDGPGHRDPAIRPNQILAVSLPGTPLAPERFAPVLATVEKALASPFGLRSLAPEEPGYFGTYIGDRYERDSQYHNGPVWGWLLGPWATAAFRVRGDSSQTRRALREAVVEPALAHMRGRGLGQIAEIYDGDNPHAPRGCFAQAWSVAELLRAMVDHGLFPERPS